jgi:hypothetical protein
LLTLQLGRGRRQEQCRQRRRHLGFSQAETRHPDQGPAGGVLAFRSRLSMLLIIQYCCQPATQADCPLVDRQHAPRAMARCIVRSRAATALRRCVQQSAGCSWLHRRLPPRPLAAARRRLAAWRCGHARLQPQVGWRPAWRQRPQRRCVFASCAHLTAAAIVTLCGWLVCTGRGSPADKLVHSHALRPPCRRRTIHSPAARSCCQCSQRCSRGRDHLRSRCGCRQACRRHSRARCPQSLASPLVRICASLQVLYMVGHPSASVCCAYCSACPAFACSQKPLSCARRGCATAATRLRSGTACGCPSHSR